MDHRNRNLKEHIYFKSKTNFSHTRTQELYTGWLKAETWSNYYLRGHGRTSFNSRVFNWMPKFSRKNFKRIVILIHFIPFLHYTWSLNAQDLMFECPLLNFWVGHYAGRLHRNKLRLFCIIFGINSTELDNCNLGKLHNRPFDFKKKNKG
jgi:hypothetical protein